MNAEQTPYIAVDIYDRKEANANGESGDVYTDLADALEAGDFSAFEDYFGDQDPFEFL